MGSFEELGDLSLEAASRPRRATRVASDFAAHETLMPSAARHCRDSPRRVRRRRRHLESPRDAKYDLNRAIALLYAYANVGRAAEADALFQQATAVSTLSETYLNYAVFLAGQHREAEARTWAERILAKKATMPAYLRRRERPWFRKAAALLKRLPAR